MLSNKLITLNGLLGTRVSLTMRLFSYFALVFITFISLQMLIRLLLMNFLLGVPERVQQDLTLLADQAEELVSQKDWQALHQWELDQDYNIFILNAENESLSQREIHPHYAFKLRFERPLSTRLNSEVNRPILFVPLSDSYRLVASLPREEHPAHLFMKYIWYSNLLLTIIVLGAFSRLLARNLQRPLLTLQRASHRLASGDFNVEVKKQVGKCISEFYELARDFDEMAIRIASLNDKQARLIRDVSHELRTPLARHDIALHLVRDYVSEDKQYLLDNLQQESDEMNKLVGDILDYCQLGNASYACNLQPTQLAPLCQLLLNQCQLHLDAQQTLTSHFADATPMVLADSRLLVRVVNNLLVNACKYAGEQATISLSVRPSVHAPSEFVELIIKDNGPGIDKKNLRTIFRPFTRIEDARDKQSGGYGLGLAIVKESIQVMNGNIYALSPKSGGLTVVMTFPVSS